MEFVLKVVNNFNAKAIGFEIKNLKPFKISGIYYYLQNSAKK